MKIDLVDGASSGTVQTADADRALLELAAKAAGIDYYIHNEKLWIDDIVWTPLADDGQALRLAVKLELRVTVIGEGMCEVSCPDTRDFKPVFEHESDGDTYAATRRAIVRAAAKIGRSR